MPNAKISVVIGAYNAARTIRATIDSVVGQTQQPHEILIMDDGSTDDTWAVINSCASPATVLRQKNAGCAATRNELCTRAEGDILAFLDSDDIWHPEYLAFQKRAFEQNSTAGLFFTGHVDFEGFGRFRWNKVVRNRSLETELIQPIEFVRRYYAATGPFTSPSYCCVRRKALLQAGHEPFKIEGADDAYLFTLLPLFGWSVVYNPTPLAARRILGSSQSANTLWAKGRTVKVFETLGQQYSRSHNLSLRREFEMAFAQRTREYAKLLMGAGRMSEARSQLLSSVRVAKTADSKLKSLVLLLVSQLPDQLQPKWSEPGRRADSIPVDLGTLEPG